MLAKTMSCALQGLDGYIVDVEADASGGLPQFDIVGLPDTAVKEAKDRVRTAIKNCGFDFPSKRYTVNLAPAHIKKGENLLAIKVFTYSDATYLENQDMLLASGIFRDVYLIETKKNTLWDYRVTTTYSSITVEAKLCIASPYQQRWAKPRAEKFGLLRWTLIIPPRDSTTS